MRRARLLLALEEELDVDRRPNVLRAQGVEGGEYRHHARLVVRSRARVETPLRIYRLPFDGHRQDSPALLEGRVAQRRRPRLRTRPLLRVCRLAVVVCVDDYGARPEERA